MLRIPLPLPHPGASPLWVLMDDCFASFQFHPSLVRTSNGSPYPRLELHWLDLHPSTPLSIPIPEPTSLLPRNQLDLAQWTRAYGNSGRRGPKPFVKTTIYLSLSRVAFLFYPTIFASQEGLDLTLEAWRMKPWYFVATYHLYSSKSIRPVDGDYLNLQFMNLTDEPAPRTTREGRKSRYLAEDWFKTAGTTLPMPSPSQEIIPSPPPTRTEEVVVPEPLPSPSRTRLADLYFPQSSTPSPEPSHVQPSTPLPPADHTLPSPTSGAPSLPDEAGPGGPPPRRD